MPIAISVGPAARILKYPRTRSASVVVPSDGSYPTLSSRRFQFRPLMLTDIAPLAALSSEHRIADIGRSVAHDERVEIGCELDHRSLRRVIVRNRAV